MSNAGRPPKSTNLLIKQGTYRKDRHGDRADIHSNALAQSPKHPDNLNDVGMHLWYLVCEESIAMGTMAAIDMVSLQAACVFYMQFKELEEIVAEKGLMITIQDKHGNPIILENPASKAMRATWDSCSRILAHFGFTPASRAKLKITPKQEEGDEFD